MDSEEFRRQADFCIRLSNRTTDERTRRELRKLAATYRRLSEQSDNDKPVTQLFFGRAAQG